MNLRVGFLTGLLVFSLVVTFTPSATAQACQGGVNLVCQTTTEILITPPTAPIKPLGPFQALPITVRYTYVPTSISLGATPIALAVANAPPWAVITISPSTVYIPVSQTEANQNVQTKTAQAFLLVSTTADAPAFTQGNIEITASAQTNGNLQASQARNAIPVQADFFSIIEASTPSLIQKAKPQAEVLYPVTVTNFGNALTKVEFVVESLPEKWQVTPPSPITLESRQQGGQQNSKTAQVTVQTPFQNGYLNVVGAITVRLRSTYALDPKIIGDSTIVSTLTTTKGFYVPGFDALFGLAALGVAGVAFATKPGKRQR
jgi:hypothetical protein